MLEDVAHTASIVVLLRKVVKAHCTRTHQDCTNWIFPKILLKIQLKFLFIAIQIRSNSYMVSNSYCVPFWTTICKKFYLLTAKQFQIELFQFCASLYHLVKIRRRLIYFYLKLLDCITIYATRTGTRTITGKVAF